MKDDVVRLQQEQVTIMTQGQWNFNVIKQWMTATNDVMGFEARGSSVYSNVNQFGPKFAINGEVSNKNHLFFHSELEMHPWLEVKFPFPVLISSVTIINRKDSCWGRLRNVEVRAGMTPVPEGFTAVYRGLQSNKKLEVNTRCGYFEGPARGFVSEGYTIVFDRPIQAQYITLQILEKQFLQINGLKINGGDLLNHNEPFLNEKKWFSGVSLGTLSNSEVWSLLLNSVPFSLQDGTFIKLPSSGERQMVT